MQRKEPTRWAIIRPELSARQAIMGRPVHEAMWSRYWAEAVARP